MSKTSRIRDNSMYGTVADFLRDKIQDGSVLSIVSAYFTIYAFDKPKEERGRILSEQAKEMADFYENDAEWREWESGPIIEYDIPSDP